MSENNRSGGKMPMPPAANETPTQDAPTSDSTSEKVVDVTTGAPPADSTVSVKETKKGMMVTALRKGFYAGLRKNPGDRFLIVGKKAWGTWMECDDKKVQEELEKLNKERIKQIRQL